MIVLSLPLTNFIPFAPKFDPLNIVLFETVVFVPENWIPSLLMSCM